MADDGSQRGIFTGSDEQAPKARAVEFPGSA
jgi:hypothetical protein